MLLKGGLCREGVYQTEGLSERLIIKEQGLLEGSIHVYRSELLKRAHMADYGGGYVREGTFLELGGFLA